jgi:hypothetical protein
MAARIRVCLWGAFDVANYGDRLFPLITEELLRERQHAHNARVELQAQRTRRLEKPRR